MFNYNAWFSVALEYGLSIFSIGKVGSSDDQLLTGGLTAVESLLGSEIGLTKKEGFVVDHGSSHMERIPFSYEEQNIYAQFLIQSLDSEKIDENYKTLAKTFITELSNNLLNSTLLDEIQNTPKKLSMDKINDILLESYEMTHKKIKVKTNNEFLSEIVKNVILHSFQNYNFSEALIHLSNLDDDDALTYLDSNREILLSKYILDIQNKIINDYPLIFLITQPVFFKNELDEIIAKELEFNRLNQTEKFLSEIIEEIFKDNSLKSIIHKFDINTLREDTKPISILIDKLLKTKLLKKSPLILLLTQELDLSTVIKEKVVDRVLKEYDIGNIVSQIAKALILKAHPEDEMQAKLVFDFFRDLSRIYPGGFPKQLWIIITNLLQIYANEAKQNLLKVNKLIDIDDFFWDSLHPNFKNTNPSI